MPEGGVRTYRDWDFNKAWVNFDSPNEFDRRFINSSTTLVCVGNPVFSENTDLDSIKTCGLVQTFGLRQGKQVGRIFELGSRGNFLVPGRGAGSLVLSRVIFNGPSLMGSLYPNVTEEEISAMFRKPGYNQQCYNLMSELYDRATGLFFIMHDPLNRLVAGQFFEVCYLNSQGVNVSSTANILAENVGLHYQDMIPIDPGLIEPQSA
jgi:hypothetical protein